MAEIEKLVYYTKRKGTTDEGVDYENMFVILFILQLITDNNIQNFQLSLNDASFDNFDDIVLKVETKTKEETYAIQLKQTTENKSLTIQKLMDGKNFKIENYFKSFQKMKNVHCCNLILLTNNVVRNLVGQSITLNVESIDQPKQKENIVVEVMVDEPHFSVAVGEGTNSCYKFRIIQKEGEGLTNTARAYQQFFNVFFLYSDQPNRKKLEKDTKEKFQKMFSCTDSAFYKLVMFIKEWRLERGKVKMLNKTWMQHLVTLHLLESSIRPLSFGTVNANMKILRNAISKCTITRIEERSYDKLKRLWGDLQSEVGTDRRNELRKLYNLRQDDFSKLLWLTDMSPLIVTESETVYEIAKMCPNKNFVVIGKNDLLGNIEDVSVFQNLADLPEIDEITRNFRCSLQGIEDKCLNFFIEQHTELKSIVTVDVLVEMLEDCYVIGGRKEDLSELYISRCLTRNIIDSRYLGTWDDEDTLIVLDCDNKFLDIKSMLPRCNFVDIVDYLDDSHSEDFLSHFNKDILDYTIYKSENQCDSHLFDALYLKNPGKRRYHHFSYLADGNLEWIRSRGEIDDLEKYRLEVVSCTQEREFCCGEPANNINLIVDDPGTGKTLILKSFKNNFPSNWWVVIFTPKDIEALFAFRAQSNHPDNGFSNFLFKHKTCNVFDQKVLEMFLDKHQVAYFWDALDEISEQHIMEFVTNLINTLSKTSPVQWVTGRTHLKPYLEKKFTVLSRKIVQFSKVEQRGYIETRLKHLTSNIREIIFKLKLLLENKDFLGNPLKLEMLTALFRQNPRKYLELIGNTFSLVDLFDYIIEDRFNVFFDEKVEVNSRVKRNMQKHHLENYEKAALKALLPDEIFTSLGVSYDGSFDDLVGFITEVVNGTPRFIHNCWAEYFLALHCSKRLIVAEKLRDILFREKYNSVRFFLDLLLANESSPHFAVLNKNVDLLKTHTSEIAHSKDKGGRLVSHLICSWMERYPILGIEEGVIDDHSNSLVTPENAQSLEMLEHILKRCDVSKEDKVFKMNSVLYAIKSECLIALLQLLRHKNIPIDDDVLSNLMYYSARLGHVESLDLFKPEHANIRTKTNRDSLLHLSICHRDYVVKLLEKKRDMVHDKNDNGETPLFDAARKEGTEIVDVLIKHGSDVNVFAKNDRTPLYEASRSGQLENVKLLIAESAEVNAQTRDGQTLLYIAARHGHASIVSLFIDSGVSVDTATRDGWTPLNAACQNRYTSVVEILLRYEADVDIPNSDGQTPLWISSYDGYEEIVKLLLDKGAKTDASTKEKWSSLHVACQNGHTEVARLLVSRGADVNATTCDKWTPLHAASKNGREDIVKLLVTRGARVDAVTKDGRTPLYVSSDEEIEKVLIESGAQVNLSENKTPLYRASCDGHLGIVKILVKTEGINLNSVTKDGQTSVYIACYKGHEKIVEVLLKAGADVNRATEDGWTPLHVASYFGHELVAKLLFQHGALKDRVNSDEKTPLQVALDRGQMRIVNLLKEDE